MMTRWIRPQSFFIVLATLGSLAGTRSASAALIPVLVSAGVEDANVPLSLFDYTVTFSSTGGVETLRTGDTLTLYDVGPMLVIGYSAGTPALAAFTITQPLVGATPAGTAPTDKPGVANVLLTYTGPSTSTSFSFDLALRQETKTPQTARGTFTSSDGLGAGASATIGSVQLPVALPEPMTLASVAFAGLLGLVRRRRV